MLKVPFGSSFPARYAPAMTGSQARIVRTCRQLRSWKSGDEPREGMA
jgi:hypothetical protein